jgi:hypothetical protein
VHRDGARQAPPGASKGTHHVRPADDPHDLSTNNDEDAPGAIDFKPCGDFVDRCANETVTTSLVMMSVTWTECDFR